MKRIALLMTALLLTTAAKPETFGLKEAVDTMFFGITENDPRLTGVNIAGAGLTVLGLGCLYKGINAIRKPSENRSKIYGTMAAVAGAGLTISGITLLDNQKNLLRSHVLLQASGLDSLKNYAHVFKNALFKTLRMS
ncbi:MAG: hypothetical protein WCE21_01215 [Candidatus Babeliales bacterium]